MTALKNFGSGKHLNRAMKDNNKLDIDLFIIDIRGSVTNTLLAEPKIFLSDILPAKKPE
jgi:hypothetical protein